MDCAPSLETGGGASSNPFTRFPLQAYLATVILEGPRGSRRGAVLPESLFRIMQDPQPAGAVTELLARARAGDSAALVDVFPLIYRELHELAERQLSREPDGHTLSPTALLHEAYIRLVDYTRTEWSGRAHFMAVAATAMRRVLIDHARSHRSLKRGGTLRRVPLDSADLPAEDRAELLLALDDALNRLRDLDERQARVVECRFFGGMTEAETAEALSLGLRTVKRDWSKARAWLYREVYGDAAG